FTQNTQNTVQHSYFTYQETSAQPNLTGTQPHILHIDHYNDNSGTAVVRIARINYYNYVTENYCYEQRLLLRVIQKNGSVIPINYENATEIQDINYCYIINNITPKNGFLRFSAETDYFKWSQYG
ncbi:25518_t:CDS:2, partial [Gigaspora rosea]